MLFSLMFIFQRDIKNFKHFKNIPGFLSCKGLYLALTNTYLHIKGMGEEFTNTTFLMNKREGESLFLDPQESSVFIFLFFFFKNLFILSFFCCCSFISFLYSTYQ